MLFCVFQCKTHININHVLPFGRYIDRHPIRDDGFYPRHDFYNILGINNNTPNLLEIPLAKITRRKKTNFALSWYKYQTDLLIDHILNNAPYNI
jgi:hypothetical protein